MRAPAGARTASSAALTGRPFPSTSPLAAAPDSRRAFLRIFFARFLSSLSLFPIVPGRAAREGAPAAARRGGRAPDPEPRCRDLEQGSGGKNRAGGRARCRDGWEGGNVPQHSPDPAGPFRADPRSSGRPRLGNSEVYSG